MAEKIMPLKKALFKALKLFTLLNDDKIDAIYALRCSFAHDYSLFNIPTNGKPSLFHYFQVHQGENGEVVYLPEVRWDGNHQNQTPQNLTKVNLELLGDLVEGICTNLKNLAEKDELEIMLTDGSDELIYRYSFWSKKG